MPGLKRRRTHADDFADLEERAAVDYDPEDDALPSDSDAGSGSSEPESNGLRLNGRAHYQSVGKSRLRQQDPASLGPQYAGAKVSRSAALIDGEEKDPFETYGIDEESEEIQDSEENEGEGHEYEDPEETYESGTEDTSIDEDNNARGEADLRGKASNQDRAELRRIMNAEQSAISASITQAARVDAEKGRAVKRQRKAFDALLNSRIRLQQGLIAINSVQALETEVETASKNEGNENEVFEAAEKAALSLWNSLEQLRNSIGPVHSSSNATTADELIATRTTTNTVLWRHMKSIETHSLPKRASTLRKWSTKTQPTTTASLQRPTERLNPTSIKSNSILDIIDEGLAPTSFQRLLKRTRLPRSCAPVQASRNISESDAIFDDADFYGVLLKELLEQRSVDTASAADIDMASKQWRAAREAKIKKNVDTRASKGRKMRFTVHEKLQNFMAPEDRGTWADRQIDELFGSLLGKRMGLAEDEEGPTEGNDSHADEALMLFRN